MNYIHLLLFLFLSGLPPLFCRTFRLVRLTGAAGLGAMCLAGLLTALGDLYAGRTVTLAVPFLAGLPFTFTLDPLAAFFLVPLFLVGATTAIYSYHYLDNPARQTRIAVHYLFLALLIAAMAGVILAGTMISFAFCWEAMSVASAVLVLFDYEAEDNRRAAFRYFLYAQGGGLFILIAFGLLCAAGNTFNLAAPANLSEDMRLAVFFLALLGFGSKAGLAPLHVWLPHAHPAAPSHVSALMSGVMIKLGVYGLLRLYIVLAPDPGIVAAVFIIIGAISAVLGILAALGQGNVKRLLAYSSVENIGIVFLGCGLGFLGLARGNAVMAGLGFTGSLLHVWNHALFKSLLFFGAGNILHGAGTPLIDHLGGLIKKMPATGLLFLAGSLAICGLPPFNGFVSEFLIYFAAFGGLATPQPAVLLIILAILALVLAGGLALACFTKLYGVAFLGAPRSQAAAQAHEVKAGMFLPMGLSALLCLVLGLFPGLFVLPALNVAGLLAKHPLPVPPALAMCTSITAAGAGFLLLLIAVFLVRRFFSRRQTMACGPTWGCGFIRPTARMQYTAASYARSILLFFKPLTIIRREFRPLGQLFPAASTYRSRSHDIIELFGERFIGRPLAWCAARLRFIQHGNIQLYIAYIVLAVIVLLLVQAV